MSEPVTEADIAPEGLPIGGQTDICGICGNPPQFHDDVLLGLNGIVCRNCQEQLMHFTPHIYAFRQRGTHNYLTVIGYQSHPCGHFFQMETPGLFFHQPMQTSKELNEFYRELSDTTKTLLWSVPAGEIPTGYQEIQPPWKDECQVAQIHSPKPIDADHPLRRLDSLTCEQYLITGNSIIVSDNTLTESVQDHLETVYPVDTNEAENAALTAFNTDSTDSKSPAESNATGGTVNNQTEEPTPGEDESPPRQEQAGLTDF